LLANGHPFGREGVSTAVKGLMEAEMAASCGASEIEQAAMRDSAKLWGSGIITSNNVDQG